MNRRTVSMNRGTLTLVAAVFLMVAAVCYLSLAPRPVSAQSSKNNPVPVYNPYPPGILPADLDSEIARVQREVSGIEQEAIAESQALPPITFTGQPPTIQGAGYDAVRVLGKLMNFDQNISVLQDQACASCHMPYAGYSGPIP
jgi:cytochrome c peroxidase